jgi:hypothetical protein
MNDRLNPDAEMERLRAFHDRIARLREQVRRLKEKQSDIGDVSPRDSERTLPEDAGAAQTHSKKY